MIKECIRKIIRTVPPELQAAIKAEIRNHYEESGKPDIDWDDPEVRRRYLQELVEDAESIIAILADKDGLEEL